MEPEIYDLYYEIASGVSRVVKQLIIAILFAGLCRHFMVNAKARRRVWMVGAAYFVMVVVYLCVPTEVHAFIVYLVAILVAFLVLRMLEKENRQVKFLLCYIFFSVRWVASSLSTELTYFAEVQIEEWVILRSGISQESMMRTLYFIFCGARVIECVLTALIVYGICKGIERMFFFNRNGMEKKEMLLLMLPATLGMLYFISNERNVIVVLEKTDRYLSDMIPEFTLMESAMEIILIAAIMSMLWLYQKLKQEQAKKQSDRLLLQEVRSMRAHIEEVEQLHDGLRGLRHDMRNHISVLQGLMKRGAFGQAQAYLDSLGRSYSGEAGKSGAVYAGKQPEENGAEDAGKQPEKNGAEDAERRPEEEGTRDTERRPEEEGMGDVGRQPEETGAENDGKLPEKEGIENAAIRSGGVDSKHGEGKAVRETEIMTGNPVTDVILAEHRHRIMEAGMMFEADFHYPDSAVVDAFDLSVIFDNALTNAREATPRGGRIRIRSFREHQAYLIVVENTFEGELAGRGADGLLMTTKRPAEEHGFGLRHIKTVVERYHGAMTIEQKGDTVVLSMMLCI